MSGHPLRWQAPQPLWSRFGADTATAAFSPEQARPAILRFGSDEFMEQIFAILERDPTRIDALLAREESWRKPMADAPDLIERTPLPQLAKASARAAAAVVPKAPVPAPPVSEGPLKLYQPAHQRYYLATASLVCGVQGLPEHAVIPSGSEEVFTVLRRLMPAPNDPANGGTLHEFAYVKSAQGARWQRCDAADDAARYIPGEERLPVFSLSFNDDGNRRRALWTGMIPVGRREEYLGSKVDHTAAIGLAAGQRGQLTSAAPVIELSKQARMAQFQMAVAEPWKTLIRSAYKFSSGAGSSPTIAGESEPSGDGRTRVYDFNLQQQGASWLILLDCADLIATWLPDVWDTIEHAGNGYAALSEQRRKLYDWLGSAGMGDPLRLALRPTDAAADIRTPLASLRDALIEIRKPGIREKLEATTSMYAAGASSTLGLPDWPPFHFCLAGVSAAMAAVGPFGALDTLVDAGADIASDPITGNVPGQAVALKVDRFTALFTRALDATAETDAPPIPFALQVKNALGSNLGAGIEDGGWFVVRFVHHRRDCGPLHPPLVSAPTRRFKLASFFDADAPARPIRISLPADTSPAGLRKYNRNTAFVMSDMLCGQVQRAKGLGLVDLVRSVLPWPLHKALDVGGGGPCKSGNGIDIGMICSISIPIITICALILLIIIVSLLDFIFRWLPYFVLCFPVPGLKGKKGAS